MLITVNGSAVTIESGDNLQSLVDQLSLGGAKIAVELNRQIIPRSEFANRLLTAGDEVEIVHAIGGG